MSPTRPYVSEVGVRMCSALPTGDNPASSGGTIDKGGCRSALQRAFWGPSGSIQEFGSEVRCGLIASI